MSEIILLSAPFEIPILLLLALIVIGKVFKIKKITDSFKF